MLHRNLADGCVNFSLDLQSGEPVSGVYQQHGRGLGQSLGGHISIGGIRSTFSTGEIRAKLHNSPKGSELRTSMEGTRECDGQVLRSGGEDEAFASKG